MPPSVATPANITIAHEEDEEAGSPRENVSLVGFTATRTLICAWPDRIKLAAQLVGGISALGGDARSIAYTLPHEYPHQVGVFCSGVSGMTGFGYATPSTDLRVAKYDKARLTVEYEAPTFNTDGGFEPSVEESLEPSAEFLTTSNESLFWDTSGTDPGR